MLFQEDLQPVSKLTNSKHCGYIIPTAYTNSFLECPQVLYVFQLSIFGSVAFHKSSSL